MAEVPPVAGVPRILLVASCADVLLAAGGFMVGSDVVMVAGLSNAALLFLGARLIIGHRIIERIHRDELREHWSRNRG